MKQKNKQPSKRHPFDFEGGDDLTTMGASWFISYLYHIEIDSNHRNWESLKTKNGRISVFKRTLNDSTSDGVAMHLHYVREICEMETGRLATNHIGLSGESVIKIAKLLRSRMEAQP